MRTATLAGYVGLITVATIGLGVLIAAGQQSDVKPKCAVNAGEKAPEFQAQTVTSAPVNFPDDYKGKVVLLDFWATWCPDCRVELPNVLATYDEYHTNGFEIVGVSLDKPDQSPVLLRFIKEHVMPWPEIYDGGYWQAALAVKYGVHAIPCPVLVDGDTGKVLAVGAGAIGKNLPSTVEAALAAKNRK